MKVVNLAVFAFLFISDVSLGATTLRKQYGEIETLKDGAVTCQIYWHNNANVSMSCSGQVNVATTGEWKVDLKKGSVERTVLDGRVCYIVSGFQNGGISCL
jgi:hypothetical protein